MYAICKLEDTTLNLKVGDTREIQIDSDDSIIDINVVLYCSIESEYFNNHFEIVGKEVHHD